jgi:hypothetical protein
LVLGYDGNNCFRRVGGENSFEGIMKEIMNECWVCKVEREMSGCGGWILAIGF